MKKVLKGDTIPGIVSIVVGVIILILTLTGSDMGIITMKKRGAVGLSQNDLKWLI